MPFELNPQPADQGLGWFQAGAAIGARNADRRLQAQELKSREAERVVRERQIAAQIQHLDLQNQIIQQGIKEKADQDAQWANLTTQAQAVHKIISADAPSGPVDEGAPPRDIPDANEVLANMALPLAGSNPNAKKFIDTFAASKLKEALAEKNLQQPALKQQELDSKALLNQARMTKLDAETAALQSGGKLKPSEFERNVNFINEQRVKAGDPELSPAEFMDMAKRHMGVLPKASAAGQWFDKAEVGALVKEHGELQKEINDLQTSAPPRTKAQREQRAQSIAAKLARQVKIDSDIEAKRTKVEAVKGETQAAPASATAPVTSSPRVKIKDSNGKEFTIPADQLKQALDEGYTESK